MRSAWRLSATHRPNSLKAIREESALWAKVIRDRKLEVN